MGRARLCRGTLVGGGYVGRGIPGLFGCEPIDVAAINGEGSHGVDGIAGVDAISYIHAREIQGAHSMV